MPQRTATEGLGFMAWVKTLDDGRVEAVVVLAEVGSTGKRERLRNP